MRLSSVRIFLDFFAILALVLAHVVKNEIFAMILTAVCSVAALAVLYANLGDLSGVSEGNPKLKVLRFVTIFNVCYIVVVILFAMLLERGILRLSEQQSRWALAAIFGIPVLVFGNVAPQIPFNRHTGLRLPWTVRDEETWIVAHRILGYISFPVCIMLFMAVPVARRPEFWMLGLLAVWIGIPGILSGIFFYRKWN